MVFLFDTVTKEMFELIDNPIFLEKFIDQYPHPENLIPLKTNEVN